MAAMIADSTALFRYQGKPIAESELLEQRRSCGPPHADLLVLASSIPPDDRVENH
jgi:hypothetical protein